MLTVTSARPGNADVQAIRTLRLASNAAIAAHNLGRLRPVWEENIHVTAGNGGQLVGREAVSAAFEKSFADSTFVTYVRTPDQIEISQSGVRAAETGHWVGRWRQRSGFREIRGTYLAMWQKTQAAWQLHSELYVSLRCAGQGECK